jgi:hypothetical protein
MAQTSYLPVKVVLWVIAIYHLVGGLAATLAQRTAADIGAFLFGVQITMTPQAEVLIRYIGAFGIAFAVLAGLAALAPDKNRVVIYGLVTYFVVRAFSRLLFARVLEEHTIGPIPNWGRIIVILVFAVALLWFMPRTQPDEPAA